MFIFQKKTFIDNNSFPHQVAPVCMCFSCSKIILGSVLLSMTLHSEPPIEILAPGVWDISQPTPVILQVSARL